MNYELMNKSSRALVFSFWLIGSIFTAVNIPILANEIEVPTIVQSNNWQVIEGKGVRLSLPAAYIGGNPEIDLDKITAKLVEINPEYSNRIEAIKRNATAISFSAFDTSPSNSSFITNVNIVTESIPTPMTLEQYSQTSLQELARVYQIELEETVAIGPYEATKIIAQLQTEELSIKQLFYLIQTNEANSDETRFWVVVYSTTMEEFDSRLANFANSIQTFSLQQ